MTKIPFIKYTSYGNNFVIVDETRAPLLTEFEKMSFAYQATNVFYGVGSDNFLIIQPCNIKILNEINKFHGYWENIPDTEGANFIFRMFEPNGEESFSCGNGLICIADYIYRKYDKKFARIMTEIPSLNPKVITIGTNPEKGKNWANMGHPRKIPLALANPYMTRSYDKEIDMIKDLSLSNFRQTGGLEFFTNDTSFKISGFLVFTGEPHFVVFSETGFSIEDLGKNIFLTSNEPTTLIQNTEKRLNSSSSFIQFIGDYFEREFSHIFPAGININFVRVVDSNGILEYRCFERGINRETLACGTGAVAIAFIARRLKMLTANPIHLWPHRCRWYDPYAQSQVKETEKGWILFGAPVMLFEGIFMLIQPEIEKNYFLNIRQALANKSLRAEERTICNLSAAAF
ncbi:MAG: hypothetical protein JW786_10490 [Desulfobacterales bacterium]|nr:hypothetical protein [Desulfobacterales bacterium]